MWTSKRNVFESWHSSKHFGLNDFIIVVIITVYCKSFLVLIPLAVFVVAIIIFCAILICICNGSRELEEGRMGYLLAQFMADGYLAGTWVRRKSYWKCIFVWCEIFNRFFRSKYRLAKCVFVYVHHVLRGLKVHHLVEFYGLSVKKTSNRTQTSAIFNLISPPSRFHGLHWTTSNFN